MGDEIGPPISAESTLAPLVAVVGSDGSGKSTLSADLLAHIQKTRAAESGYLGLGSGEQGRRIGRWPIIGPPLHRFLDGVADSLREPGGPIPGISATDQTGPIRHRAAGCPARITSRLETSPSTVSSPSPSRSTPTPTSKSTPTPTSKSEYVHVDARRRPRTPTSTSRRAGC